MKKSLHRPVSNLDLKLLDVKFIAIDDNQTYLTETLQSVRKTKISQFPSLLKPKHYHQIHGQDTTIDDSSAIFSHDYKNKSTNETISQFDQSLLSNKFRSSQFSCVNQSIHNSKPTTIKSHFNKEYLNETSESQLQKIREQIKQKKYSQQKDRNRSLPLLHVHNQLNQKQQEELKKYRRKIQLIKRQNSLIHKEISSLYRNKINQNKEPLKKIRKIQPFKVQPNKQGSSPKYLNPMLLARTTLKQNFQMNSLNMKRTLDLEKVMKKSFINSQLKTISKKLVNNPIVKQKLNFYENLVDKSPYKQQLDNVHKKIISNNLHKNFEQYLTSMNKRIPEFIKKLRT